MKNIFILAIVSTALAGGPLTAEENKKLQATCGNFTLDIHRSMNTKTATREEAPFAVYLPVPGCSGILISSRHVVTAAHCINLYVGCAVDHWDQKPGIFPSIGQRHIKTPTVCNKYECDSTLPREKIGFRRVFFNRDYIRADCKDTLFLADIAIIELEEDVQFTDELQPACLAAEEPPINSTIKMFGYGEDENKNIGVLRKLVSRVVSTEECLKYPNFTSFNGNGKVNNDELCSRNESALACPGDSGSGHFSYANGRANLVGILSKGIECNPEHPPELLMDFSTRSAYYNGWICAVTGVCTGGFERNEKLIENYKGYYHVYTKGKD